MKSSLQKYEIEILVNGKPITEYAHKGNTYVEGRKGSEYSIRIRNNTNTRIVAITSVDGLNVLTGEPASSQDSGFVLNAYETIEVPGWKLNNAEGAKFTFSDPGGSYSVQAEQGDNNLGLIGLKVFKEKPRYIGIPTPVIRHYSPLYDDGLRPRTMIPDGVPWYGSSTSVGIGSADGALYSKSTCDAVLASCSNNASMTLGAAETVAYAAAAAPEPANLGTGFGQVTEMRTTQVAFERESFADATLIVNYNTKKNLQKLGIEFPSKPKKKKKESPKPEPTAFPGDGCRPPKGWKRS